MRALWMVLGLCLAPAISRADVVVFEQTQTNSAYLLDSFAEKYGQAFTNTAGTVAVSSVNFFLKKTGTVTGDLLVKVYASANGSGNYTPNTASELASSNIFNAATISTSESQISFTGFSPTSTLTSGQTFFAVLDTSNLTSTLDASNYIEVFINGPGSPTLNAASQQGLSAWVAEAYQIKGSVVMVPEPGTLLLGGIAAACGGGGAWWRRRLQKANQPAATKTAA